MIFKNKCKSRSFNALSKEKKIELFVNHIDSLITGNRCESVYVKENEDLPDEYTKVSERLYNILIRQESYKIGSWFIRNYIVSKIKFIDANKLYKEHGSLIEDAFCNNPTAKTNQVVFIQRQIKPSNMIL